MQNENERRMSFLEHLEELRKRIIICVIYLFLASCVCYLFSPKILSFLKGPVEERLVFLSPTEAFLARIKVAIFTGLGAISPLLLYQIWKFIAPGLKTREKRYIFPTIIFSLFFFILGFFLPIL
ncbi:MAG: twin-arginine translocase subunit TatC [bacterium]|nr:twin-arginine translocase subunit TatC [bacterium]